MSIGPASIPIREIRQSTSDGYKERPSCKVSATPHPWADLAFEAGWVVLLLGLAAIFSAIAYTGGPLPLGYYGLGDLFVFLFFGLASVAGTYFVQAGKVSPAAWWMSLPIGLIIVGILVINNLRDIETDSLAGKHTLAVRLGERFANGEYIFCLLVAFLCLPLLCAFGVLP